MLFFATITNPDSTFLGSADLVLKIFSIKVSDTAIQLNL